MVYKTAQVLLPGNSSNGAELDNSVFVTCYPTSLDTVLIARGNARAQLQRGPVLPQAV